MKLLEVFRQKLLNLKSVRVEIAIMFKNLKISAKLLMSTFVFIFPIGVLLYFVIFVFNKDIAKAESEIKGNKALSSVVSITNDVIELQNLLLLRSNDTLSINEEFYSKRINLILKVKDQLTSNLISSTEIYNEKIASFSNLENEISPYTIPVNLVNLLNSEIITQIQTKQLNNEPFNKFYSGSQELIKFISDDSGLILDPDLDSYYLMDISALVLPKLQIQMGEVLSIMQSTFSSNELTQFDANKVRLLLDLIEFDYLERIKSGVQTSLREDKNFYHESETLRKNLTIHFDNFNKSMHQFINIGRNWYNGYDENDEQLLSDVKNHGFEALNTSVDFWKDINVEFDILLQTRIEHYKYLRLIALLSSGFAFILAVVLVLYVSKQISRHLGIVTSIAVEIAEGNIDKAVSDISSEKNLGVFKHYTDDKINVSDEILILFRAIRKMTFNLSSLLVQVSKSANQVSGTTFQITSSAHDIEATVAEQAALTNQVNATSKEISKTAADLARTMDFLTLTFHDNATMLMSGLENLNEIKLSINELFESSNEISQKLDLIKERAASINSVITTITKVANQTNLVSLNASIEAERAGTFGTGFAVVAREIRRLADQTAVAALNIEDMITEMQVAVSEGGDTIIKYMGKSQNSAEKTAHIIDRLSVLIDRTNELPEKIFIANIGMKQQSESAVQIDESMQQLNSAAIQTRNTIIEFNSATEKLNESVRDLTSELKNFSLKSIT